MWEKVHPFKSDEDITEYTTLVQDCKDFLTKLDDGRTQFVDNETKKHDVQVFSQTNALKASLDLAIESCKTKFTRI